MATSVAILGMGRMGAAMAGTLSKAGFAPVLYNRTRAKAEDVAAATGGRVAANPAEAAAAVDVVISSLADDAAVREVYLGDEGVVAGIGDGTVALEMSTIDPDTAIAVGDHVDAAGGVLLDAPVSGSVQLVEAGSLTIMVGGDEEAMARARPVLDALAAKVFHMGPRGTGATIKLAVNALVHAINVALSEALVMAERAGVERSMAYEVFAAGAAGAPFVHYKRAAFEDPDTTPVAFSVDLVAKDLELITGLGRRLGVDMAQAETNLAVAREAIAAGFGDRDMSAIAVHLREEG